MLPFELEMTHPGCDQHKRRPFARGGVGDANPIGGGAEADLLFHTRRPLPYRAAIIAPPRESVKAAVTVHGSTGSPRTVTKSAHPEPVLSLPKGLSKGQPSPSRTASRSVAAGSISSPVFG